MAAPELSALDAALAPPRAHGEPPASGLLRVEPEDFVVEEELGFAPAGSGAHLLLRVRKRNANTQWVARELARLAGCRPAEVGYAGLKDRRALALQWYSVPRPRNAVDWRAVCAEDYEILEVHAHTRKLLRGAHARGGRGGRRARGAPRRASRSDRRARRTQLLRPPALWPRCRQSAAPRGAAAAVATATRLRPVGRAQRAIQCLARGTRDRWLLGTPAGGRCSQSRRAWQRLPRRCR